FGLGWGRELAHQQDIERRLQAVGEDGADLHTAPRQAEHDTVAAAIRLQRAGKQLPRLDAISIAEDRVGQRCGRWWRGLGTWRLRRVARLGWAALNGVRSDRPLQLLHEPRRGEIRHLLECSGLFEEVGCSGDDLEA